MKFKRMNRKGNIIDLFYVAIFIFAFALVVIFGQTLMDDLNADGGITETTEGQAVWDENYNDYTSLFNNIFMFIFVGMAIAVIVSAFFVQSHPLFYFVAVIIFSILSFVTALFSNVYEEVIGDGMFATASTGFTFMNHVMSYFPLYIIIISFVVAIVLYAKGR